MVAAAFGDSARVHRYTPQRIADFNEGVTVPTDIQWIRTDADLASRCQAWRELPFVALDTEFVRVDTFYPLAGLLQVGDGKQAFLIDPLEIKDWTPFADLLCDTRVVKVLHACSEDLEVFLRLTDALPQPLFDTQLAAGYLGLGHSMGYSRLVQAVLGIELPKDETRSDWLQRPLTPLQQEYAAADAQHLAELYTELLPQLSEDKHAWLLEDGTELVNNLCREIDPHELYRDAKLGWKLSRQQLAVLQALYAWREIEARRRDQPRNRVVREHCLWPLARFQPTDRAALSRIEDMHPKTVRQDGDTLIRIIEEAGSLPPEKWPESLPPPLPSEASALLKKLRAVGQAEALRLGMAPELMLRKKVLEALLRSGFPDGPYQLPDSLKGWRRARMGEALLAALE